MVEDGNFEEKILNSITLFLLEIVQSISLYCSEFSNNYKNILLDYSNLMELDNIDIFWYTIEPINNNKNEEIQKLVFVSHYEVKELVKGHQYDNLKLILNQETELDSDNKNQIEKDLYISIERATKVKIEKSKATLKSAKVIDYEPNYVDDETISSHKYTIVAQELHIDEEPYKEFTVFTGK